MFGQHNMPDGALDAYPVVSGKSKTSYIVQSANAIAGGGRRLLLQIAHCVDNIICAF